MRVGTGPACKAHEAGPVPPWAFGRVSPDHLFRLTAHQPDATSPLAIQSGTPSPMTGRSQPVARRSSAYNPPRTWRLMMPTDLRGSFRRCS